MANIMTFIVPRRRHRRSEHVIGVLNGHSKVENGNQIGAKLIKLLD